MGGMGAESDIDLPRQDLRVRITTVIYKRPLTTKQSYTSNPYPSSHLALLQT